MSAPSASSGNATASSASGTQASAPAGPPPVQFDQLTFVLHVDFVLFGLFALFALISLPRVFARLSRSSSFTGIFLRTGTPVADEEHYTPSSSRRQTRSASNSQPMRSYSTKTNQSSRTLAMTDEDQTLNSHAHLVSRVTYGADTAAARVPTRVPTWITLTHPKLVHFLHYPLAPGLNLSQFCVLCIYAAIVLYAGFYKSNPFYHPIRAGFVAMSQFPIVVGLANKNNILSLLSNVGYEKFNYIHRFAGRMMVLAANVHGIGYLYQWATLEVMSESLSAPSNQWGLVSLISLDIILAFSTEYVRQRAYNLFLASHILGMTLLCVGMVLHYPITLPYVVAAASLYVLDQILRVLRTRTTTAYLTPHASLNGASTHVHLPEIVKGWHAGQHVRFRVINPNSNSWVGWCAAWIFSRARPFTISTRPEGSGLELIIKKQGSFTGRLYEMALGDGSISEKGIQDLSETERAEPTRRVKVLVEGPYSGAGLTMFEAYSGALLVAGGSGITYILGLAEDMLKKHAAGQSRLRVIELVWTVADPASVVAILPTLRALLRPRASPYASIAVRVTIHYTRAQRPGAPPLPVLPAGMHVRVGRPNLKSLLEETVDGVLAAHGTRGFGQTQYPSGVVVSNCGPLELGDQVSAAIGGLSWKRWKDVGGVEAVGEVFGW
ncbi:ferric reductase like transmembrane component-domain-containing protein [Amylostereum chailletii]|nr:ferric reductase like transmembrane component-domain-containing protein [Amylostereum chailletii]